MLMREDGVYTGSVSGGCVEDDLAARYRDRQIAGEFPLSLVYGVEREPASRPGLPCGGKLELLIETLDAVTPLRALTARIESGVPVARRVCLATGEVSLHPAATDRALERTEAAVIRTFGPDWHMLLIGAGQLSVCVARIAAMLNYRIVICDPRDNLFEGSLPDCAQRVGCMPDEAVARYVRHRRSVVLALTHDPKLDDMALLEALGSQAFYVGALGSRRNSELRRERLRSLGLGAAQLERLHAPVGLPIGSRSPAEIAISILAEITASRSAARQRRQGGDGPA
jgi:xanthine dehydrogenase accessory factor